ncbi:AAA family ATPase [Patescibacteria group bacterium]|nr:AAA family ATPase [Patescibacteria group bacterium]
MKKLIVIRGPLGVGKTTISKILAQNLGVGYLSLDQIIDDNDLIPANAEGIPLESFLRANAIILDLTKGHKNSHIIDGCFYYQEQIDDLLERFNNSVEIVTLTCHVEKCIERDSKRQKVYGEDSARFVHMVTTRIRAGHEIDNTNLTVEKTIEKIIEKIKVP